MDPELLRRMLLDTTPTQDPAERLRRYIALSSRGRACLASPCAFLFSHPYPVVCPLQLSTSALTTHQHVEMYDHLTGVPYLTCADTLASTLSTDLIAFRPCLRIGPRLAPTARAAPTTTASACIVFIERTLCVSRPRYQHHHLLFRYLLTSSPPLSPRSLRHRTRTASLERRARWPTRRPGRRTLTTTGGPAPRRPGNDIADKTAAIIVKDPAALVHSTSPSVFPTGSRSIPPRPPRRRLLAILPPGASRCRHAVDPQGPRAPCVRNRR
ncbi:uncharacterized protein SCHCODRAFT_01235111 [Schizophyllum commune H4-8]|uniref:uncharacterized protein n=1 Tax=Schizophyllum commune (strain H4-8 / FGSC 9210) TaxID=578458 RepID=UPI002160E34B|nr:uncharacterized protein SCHCODRAFT_01235111 [Schizophyllum commune H4-8]KAI5897751.1 hypothetical protein SCHCODRAFT_01235111 [Schizophyllum commune H4-8]